MGFEFLSHIGNFIIVQLFLFKYIPNLPILSKPLKISSFRVRVLNEIYDYNNGNVQ